MGAWLKIGYFTDSQEAAPDYWRHRTWVSDGPGRKSPRWLRRARPAHGDSYPAFGPRYEVGDNLVVYITAKGVCPAILEVVQVPRWDPGWVDANAEVGEGDRWGVVTEVRGIAAMAVDQAPPLENIGVALTSIQRKGHVSLEEWQYQLAVEEIAGDGDPDRKGTVTAPLSVEVPVEAGFVEGYDVAPRETVSRAIRRETILVRDYQAFREAYGEVLQRNQLRPPGVSHPLYSDLYNQTRNHLIEAKAGTTRGDVRMAIGQLADYGRFAPPGSRRAVLLEAKPHPDLIRLLRSQGIALIWRTGEGFADNADGAFTR